jgi:beta-phosphoglucomutase-like phosphatase (HAD superfamily)
MSALIFDMDGVLVDTVMLHHQAWQYIAQQANVPFDQSDMDRFRGLRRDDCLRQIFSPQSLDPEQLQYYSQMKDDVYHAALAKLRAEDLLLPGVREL